MTRRDNPLTLASRTLRVGPNSLECAKRYRALGGQFELETVKGAAHEGTPAFYRRARGLQFLLED